MAVKGGEHREMGWFREVGKEFNATEAELWDI